MSIVVTRPSVDTTSGGVLLAQGATADAGAPGDDWRDFSFAVADGPLSIDLEPGESLYGIVAVTTQVLHVLKSGR